MQEGEQWIGGEESPPEQGTMEFLWHKWNTESSKPCSECQSRDGTISPVWRPKPHSSCNCTQSDYWRFCTFLSRQSQGSSSRNEKVRIGQLDPGKSGSFFNNRQDSTGLNAAFNGFGGSLSSSEGTQSRYDFENDTDERIYIYEDWEITTSFFVDSYLCRGTDESGLVEVKHIKTELMGITDEPSFGGITYE